ncbi:DinB family protein [Flavobacterium sp. N2038]|uniref:DinB family protein n=1 Tax=Flavobacterium sp. N2038 TaxID=2986829 RepID=UPI0022256AEE|nr:DinB family protein [Flavobacterium sp. N2038]
MQNAILKFEKLLNENVVYFPTISQEKLQERIPGKWSKKEILGHLTDSVVHNLVRFSEINHFAKPSKNESFNSLTQVNLKEYQAMDINELTQLWFILNRQIIRIVKSAQDKAVDHKIVLADQSVMDLKFFMTNYVEHLEHHINQIKS